MFHVTAFVALFVAFVSLVLLTQVPNPLDAGAESASTLWTQPVNTGTVTSGPDDCCVSAHHLAVAHAAR